MKLWLVIGLVVLIILLPVMAAAAYENGWAFKCEGAKCELAREDFAEIIGYIRALEKRVMDAERKGACI